jgi:tryptophanase
VHYLGDQLIQAGVPLLKPLGGHCVMLEMKAFLPHIPQEQFPAEAFTAALYLDSGTRGVGLGQLAFGSEDPATGAVHYSPLEVVRLAIPRRVYTDNHMRLVANSVIRVFENRDKVQGMKIAWAAPALRHFTARLEPFG